MVVLELAGYDGLELIGEGGLGRVFSATRRSTGGTVAIKELRDVAEASPAWHRAVREVEAMLRLKGHPYVVSVEEILHGPNGPCIVMEYLSGGSLFDRLQHGPLPAAEVLMVGHHVAQALDAAHSVGVIHRDVKPHNLLIGAFGQVKVADFGISAVVRESGLRTQTQALTLAYASPEELDGESDVGPAADVYSLAATIGHLATGRKPSFRERVPLVLPFEHLPAARPVGEALRAGLAVDPACRPTMQQLVTVFDRASGGLGSHRLTALVPVDVQVTVPSPVHMPTPTAPAVLPPASPAQPAPPTIVSSAPTALAPLTVPTAPVVVTDTRPTRRGALVVALGAVIAVLTAAIAVLAVTLESDEEAESAGVATMATSEDDGAAPATIATGSTTSPATSTVESTTPTTVVPTTVLATAPAAPPVVTATPTTAVPILRVLELNCNFCKLRNEPTTLSSEVGQLEGRSGARVEVLADDSGGWQLVRVEGLTGWLFGTFVWPAPTGFVLGDRDGTAIELLTVDGAPLGIDNPSGDKVLVVATSGSLYQVLLPDGTIAYVSSSTPLRR